MIEIPIELIGGKMPTRESKYAAAFDVYVPDDYELNKERCIIGLGFKIALPLWWKANVRPRSGFLAKGTQAIVKTRYLTESLIEYTSTQKTYIDADVQIGLVDSDYRNEVGAILKVYNFSYYAPKKNDTDIILENHIYIEKDTRIAQMEICGDTNEYELVQVDELNTDIDRGGGFGHTGAK